MVLAEVTTARRPERRPAAWPVAGGPVERAHDGGVAGPPARRTPTKAEQTRARIVQAALDLFRERGYDRTTMRAVAERAGVSLGNAYYYFRSKEHLIQAYYAQTLDEQLAASRPILERERDLRKRLRGVMHAKLAVWEPYHRVSAALFKTAADPRSPLSPFSPESQPVRQQDTALFAEVLHGANVRLPRDLAAELPHLLWLYQMGVLLFWVHDDSPGRMLTRRLIDHTVDLIVRAISLAGSPLLRPVRRRVLCLLADLRQEPSPPPHGADKEE
jgi:AcrR family transcriptional regulator